MLNRIWAPWRSALYPIRVRFAQPGPECFLCRGLARRSRSGEPGRLVARANSFVVLNRYPYNNGHLLVAPRVHRGTLGRARGPGLARTDRNGSKDDRHPRPDASAAGLQYRPQPGQGRRCRPARDTSTGISFRAGMATRTSCRFWVQTKVIVESLHEFYDRLRQGTGPRAERDPHESQRSVRSVSRPSQSDSFPISAALARIADKAGRGNLPCFSS